MTTIRTPQHALNMLNRAIEFERKSATAYQRGMSAHHNHGTYSGHYARADKWADEAERRFDAVREYLQSQVAD